MSAATAPSYCSAHRASATLAVGLCLSLAIHLGVGVGASGYFGSVWDSTDSSDSQIEVEPDSAQNIAPPDKLQLGMQDASAASINWLGVIDNPEVGDVPIAQVEQAEFTKQIGDAPITTSPQPAVQPTPVVEQEVMQSVAQPIAQIVQPEVIDSQPIEMILPEQIELEIEPQEDSSVVIDIQPEPIEEPNKEPIEDQDIEADQEPVDVPMPAGPELVSVDPNPQTDRQTEPQTEPQPTRPEEQSEVVAPTTAGKDGIVSEKESAASMLKRAKKMDPKQLHKPFVHEGTEIITVEPRFPAAVRFTELPQNPVVMIRFNATGRVSKAYFLTEARKIYDTGVRGVDEPLLSAIYQWRAKGKEIDALDPTDPDSFIEISMRITFRKEGETP